MEELTLSGIILTIIAIVGLLYIVFIAYTVYHAIFRSRNEKSALWVLLILFFPIVGSIIYWVYFARSDH